MKQLLTGSEMYYLHSRGIDVSTASFKRCDIDGAEIVCDCDSYLASTGENSEFMFSLSDMVERLPKRIEDGVAGDVGILSIGPDPETGYWYCRYEVWVDNKPAWNLYSGVGEELIDAVYRLFKQLVETGNIEL